MVATTRKLEERLQAYHEACRREGLRLTPQRLEIFRELAGRDDHPDVEMLREHLRERLPNLSPDTIYRALSLFERLGLLQRVDVASDRARFDAETRRHGHFHCRLCGGIFDVPDDAVATIALPMMPTLGAVEQVRIDLCGVCAACRAGAQSPDQGIGEKRSLG